ncbi:MAG: hypothetical protein ABIV26_04405 [Candidatus Limnocylindrales bacterium]
MPPIDAALAASPEVAIAADADAGLEDLEVAADGLASGGIVPGSYLPPSTVHRASPPSPQEDMRPSPASATVPLDALDWPATLQPSASTFGTTAGGPPLLGDTATGDRSNGDPGWPGSPGLVPPGDPSPGLVPPDPRLEPAWSAPLAGATAPRASATGPVAATAPLPVIVAAPARGPSLAVPGRASILADLPFDAPDELEGWLVVLGGATAILGYLLPWRSSVASGLEGYFQSWGLGIGTNMPILVLVIVATALSVVPNRVADWFRHGVLGMVAGGVLFGLVWLYIAGGGGELGAILAAVGAVLLIGGGVIAVSPGRGGNRVDVQAQDR